LATLHTTTIEPAARADLTNRCPVDGELRSGEADLISGPAAANDNMILP